MISFRASLGCDRLNRYFPETSLAAYEGLINSKRLRGQLLVVLRLYLQHPAGLTDGEVAAITGWPRSTVSARRNGLCKVHEAYEVVVVGHRKNDPGVLARVWSLKNNIGGVINGLPKETR